MEDVYKEFDEYANKMRIMEFNCKETKKHYSFEKEGTPKTSDYLEIRYNARYPAINADYSGTAIERVFGTTVNALELLLIERKIKGPCWLDIKNISPTAGRFAWCSQIVSKRAFVISYSKGEISIVKEKYNLYLYDVTGGYLRHGQYIAVFPREIQATNGDSDPECEDVLECKAAE